MLEAGQEFKNYKELCEYLGEPQRGGDSKKAQLKRWEARFRYHFRGRSIIIDEIYGSEARASDNRGRGNNHKNRDIYLPYVYRCLFRDFPSHESATNIVCNTLGVFSKDLVADIYNNPEKYDRDFRVWVKKTAKYAMQTVIKSLEALERDGLVAYETAYAFLSKPERIKYIAYSSNFNEFITKTEAEVCDYLNKKHHLSANISGKQLEFLIFKRKALTEEYSEEKIRRLVANTALMEDLQDSLDGIFYGIDFGSDAFPIQKYWKVWSVTEMEAPEDIDMGLAKAKYMDFLINKTRRGRELPTEWKQLALS